MYIYRTAQGKATLSKSDDSKIKVIGKFKTEREALIACKKHYEKSVRSCENLGKPIPPCIFI